MGEMICGQLHSISCYAVLWVAALDDGFPCALTGLITWGGGHPRTLVDRAEGTDVAPGTSLESALKHLTRRGPCDITKFLLAGQITGRELIHRW